jgi:hypothetical protein
MRTEPTKAEILAGGTSLEVELTDGTKRTVKVALVSLRHIDELGAAWLNEAKEVALFTGLPATEIDQLTEASWSAVIEEGRRLNFTRFAGWFDRRVKTINRQTPESTSQNASSS